MKGQWIGKYEGSRSGLITINLDESLDGYAGYAHLMDGSGTAPITFAILKSDIKGDACSFNADLCNIDPSNHNTLSAEQLKHAYPELTFPNKATATVTRSGRQLVLEWQTNIGSAGTATLTGGSADDPSDYSAEQMSWIEFRNHVATHPARRYIYRGQERPWKLRTSFHRTGRSDVFKFQFDDIPALYRVLSSKTKHIYDLKDPDQNGAFFHLVQHHGYPTPLLDWSYSPFVAAFCAYRKVSQDRSGIDDKVRIFVFDHIQWHKHWETVQTLRTHKLHMSILNFIAIDNDRMIPQQALSCVTNLDDIETYIREREKTNNTSYLRVIDLPASERKVAMTDLSVMGITAGSMFPGLDGACEEIKERFFNFGLSG